VHRLVQKIWDALTQSIASRSHRRNRRPNFNRRLDLQALEDRSLLSANASGALAAQVFIDSNHNHIADRREVRLPGVAVHLDGTAYGNVPIHSVAITDAKGQVKFNNVPVGDYRVSTERIRGLLGTPRLGDLRGVLGVVLVPKVHVGAGQTPFRNLAFRGMAPGFVSLRQLLSSTGKRIFPLNKPGQGAARVLDRENNTPFLKNVDRTQLVANDGQTTSINLNNFFGDPDFSGSVERLKYVVLSKVGGTLIESATISDNILNIKTRTGSTSGNVFITVQAIDRFGAHVDGTFTFKVRKPPEVSVVLNNNTPNQNDVVTATTTVISSPDGVQPSLTYTWKVNGTIKKTETITSTTSTFDLTQAGAANRDNIVTVEVTPTALNLAGATASASATVANTPPVITSSNTINVEENATAVSTITTTDKDADPQVFTILPGSDADKFNINITTGALSFINPPDFENPGSAANSNTYTISVQADDQHGGTTTQNLTINVTNAAVTFTSPATVNVPENTTAVTTVIANSSEAGNPTFSIVPGGDSAKFSIDTNTGALTFNAAPDFENPASAANNNTYTVTVQADDGLGSIVTQTITVNVTNATVNFTSSATANPLENTTAVTTVLANSSDGTVTFSIVPGGDSAKFNINPTTGELTFIAAPDFETPASTANSNTYSVTVQGVDGNGGTGTQTITVNVTNVDEAPVANTTRTVFGASTADTALYAANNGATTTIDVSAFFDDPDITDSVVRFHVTNADGSNPQTFDLELFDKAAPQTVANFLHYVETNKYDSTFFHRVIAGFVLQGGQTSSPDPAVQNEFDGVNRSNVLGTIAMAKVGNDPNSATSEFFFNLADNSANLDHQNEGFTVFGKLVSTADQNVVNSLVGLGNNGSKITDVEIIKRADVLTYSVVSVVDNTLGYTPTATITAGDHRLNITTDGSAATGDVTVTVRVTDQSNVSVDIPFTVRVNQAPQVSVNLDTTTAGTNDILTATTTVNFAPAGEPLMLTYVWRVGSNVQKVETTTSTTSTLDLSLVGNGDTGDTVTVEVLPSVRNLTGTRVSDSALVV